MEGLGTIILSDLICYSLARFSQPGETGAAIANNVMMRLDFVGLPNCTGRNRKYHPIAHTTWFFGRVYLVGAIRLLHRKQVPRWVLLFK
jgi:hypothetical protein